MSEFHAEAPKATASEGLAQGPYVAATYVCMYITIYGHICMYAHMYVEFYMPRLQKNYQNVCATHRKISLELNEIVRYSEGLFWKQKAILKRAVDCPNRDQLLTPQHLSNASITWILLLLI